ncbi:soluble lamin-associated protein of 75 kDa isoform X1 [Athene cunicularia]|uniref:soluble lamin-associated protein of 75 kDa isoform X1 n=1 Tax=Athene cunicularia TaxID=194338 RepID=UPI000EF64832|nr:soluble lamin-associated protein of 75 kDa isoform X1 [Athene cunicularia]
MSFPVDILNTFSHEDLESSAEGYLSDLRHQDPNHCEFLSLPGHGKVTIKLGTVGFVPLYGEEQTHKVLGLFAPRDSLTAVALYLANRWWSVDDVLRTSVTTRQGLHKVESVGERIVLYVLNRIIYRTQEMGRNEIPFLCHSSNDYAKILWKKGEAIGFYSVKPKGSICSSSRGESYKLSVLDTMFVRKNHRERESGLIMLEDFVDSFREATLGLRYPLSTFMYTACKLYLDKYPEDHNLLWEVEGAGYWFQKTSIMSTLQSENLKTAKALLKGSKSFLAECHFQQSAAVSEVSEQGTELQTQPNDDSQKGNESIDVHASTSKDPNTVPVSIWTRSSHFRCPKTGKKSQESEPGTSEGDKGNAVHVSESRMKLPAPTSESDKNLIEVPEDNTVEEVEKTNEDRSVPEVEQHVSPSEESSEKKDIPSEPLNGEITEEAGKTSLTVEEETANEVLSDESELQSESQGEEPLTLFVPLVLETAGKPSEDTVSEASNINDSEMLTKEGTVVEKEGTEEQQESEKTTTENAAASTSKEETSNSGLPNPMVTEAAEESVSENVLPEVASSLEGQDEVDHNSQEAPVALSQSSLIVVELEGFSFQQPSGQEGQKNQLEEHSEEPPEQMDQHQQTAAERAADSSSEEAEVEIPIVDRRNLRRKAKCSKGPPKKKGKPA